VALTIILAACTAISFAVGVWQLALGLRFPLHSRRRETRFTPGISILKPLKGWDGKTFECLQSWLAQAHAGPIEVLFGVSSADDPACKLVQKLVCARPNVSTRVIVSSERRGLNPKVCQLAQLAQEARHEIVCVSDADVFAPPDFLTQAVQSLSSPDVGLVNALYRFAEARSFAMQLEALSVNADFWSQVLQARALAPMRFGLGAAMLLRRNKLDEIGGFAALLDYLADDCELGQRIANTGARVELTHVVVECRSAPLTRREVWMHQLRWTRTIRACQPWAYFFSILGNALFWPALWVCLQPIPLAQVSALICLGFRIVAAYLLDRKMVERGNLARCPLILIKDLFQIALWIGAFTGRTVVWRGKQYQVERGGKLTEPVSEQREEHFASAPPAAS
jgi:ceramide glucosyltransferase